MMTFPLHLLLLSLYRKGFLSSPLRSGGRFSYKGLARPAVSRPTGAVAPSFQPASQPRSLQPTNTAFYATGNKQRDFIQALSPHAQQMEASTGVPASYSLAMAANETGWNAQNPVLFGIKGRSPSGQSGRFQTWENYGQGPVTIQDEFATYANPSEAFSHLAYEMGTPRYRGAPKGSALEFARYLQSRGWATDPDYARKIAALAGQISGYV